MGIRGGRNLLCSLEALQSVIWTCLHICICIAMGFVWFLARFSHLKWGLWTISMNYLLNFLAFETSLSMLCSFKWGFFLLFVTCVIVAQVLCSFPPWNKRSADRRNGGCVGEALVLEKVCAWCQLWKFTKETRPRFNSHGNLC